MSVSRLIPVTILGLGFVQCTFAQIQVNTPVEENLPDHTPTQPEKPVAAAEESARITDATGHAAQATPQLTLEDLRGDPVMLERVLNSALLNRRWDVVSELLPIYKTQANADPLLIEYAQGSLYREEGNISQAIDIFRRLIAENPDSSRIRLELAILLFADQQNIAAKDQFQKVRAAESNETTQQMINQYLAEIEKRSSWNFSGGLSYIQDNNINNASKSKTITLGGRVFEKTAESLPQTARGIQLNASASRDFNISGSHYWALDTGIDGKWYQSKSQYNDININLTTGYKFKNVNSNWSVQPLYRYRNVGGHSYSHKYGIQANYAHWLNPNWQLSFFSELGREKNLAADNSETQWFNSVNILYAPEATRYFFGGINVYNVDAETDDASSLRTGVSIGWNQDWPKGISTRWSASLAKKAHKGVAWWGEKRQDTEFTNTVTVWNRDWHFGGITPKLTWTYRNVDSNFDDLYSYDKNNVYLTFDKTF